jgi:hypothetical protein
MGESNLIKTKAIRRTEKTLEEDEKDFYQTNPYMVQALYPHIRHLQGRLIVDPCCGEGVIVNGLRDAGHLAIGFDKFLGDNRIDYLNWVPDSSHIIVMNPPYSSKYLFMDKAIREADEVYCLLPLNISNYNMMFKKYEDIPEFIGKIQMSPKMILHKGIEFHAGGTSQYCWYIWKKYNNTKYSYTWYEDLRKLKSMEESR